MRLVTLCLGLGAFLSATVLAQELIAPEEWFESMKVAQSLVARHDKRHSKSSRHHHRQSSRHHHHANNNHSNKVANKSNKKHASSSLKLQKRRWGYPSRLEIEQRATAFNSFRADEIVDAPANLHIVKEPMVGRPAGAVKIEKATAKKAKKVAKKVKNAAKKTAKHVGKHEKRHHKASKKHHSHANKASRKKASSS
ncbi:hypothetical protein EC991_007042 [Linnemannia zychae]|nr:hypothetical protein EC991_007042 [Linnemannia zychae]